MSINRKNGNGEAFLEGCEVSELKVEKWLSVEEAREKKIVSL